MRPSWVIDSEKGQLDISRCLRHVIECTALAGALAAGNSVKASGPTKKLGFFLKKPLKDLNCQRKSPLWHFRKRSKIRLHPSGEWFSCALCVLLSPCSTHHWAAKQKRDREKWECKILFCTHSPIPNFYFALAHSAIQATSLFSNSWPLLSLPGRVSLRSQFCRQVHGYLLNSPVWLP